MRVIDFAEFGPEEGRGMPSEVVESANSIISGVRTGGDRALLGFTKRFDGVELRRSDLEVKESEIEAALEGIDRGLRAALENSARRIRDFQKIQMPKPLARRMAPGVMARVTYDPIESAGLYVPGGRAAYPSTVLMTAVPAKVAGVERVIVCSPPGKDGGIAGAILAAARIAGVDRVFRVGGAQAIAAMAYGTETMPKAEKIFGPGNIYVTAAKFAVSRDVAVDLPAGPSDVLIYAEGSGERISRLVVADMLAQSEHDPMAKSILLTPSRKLALSVSRLMEPVEEGGNGVLAKSLANGAIILVRDREEGIKAINSIAPEHLQLLCGGGEEMLRSVRNAGAVFIGEYSPVALGDYTAGTNHVLPTMGWAKRASPLSVRDFLRSRESLRCSRRGFRAIAGDALKLAEAEGLMRHAGSIRIRLEGDDGK